MATRKEVNKYYPPDWDPSKGSLNTYHGQHPLRERAKKLHLGILVVRFEMPFNVWCTTCNSHIGKGVRFNAEKKAAGKYHSTTIYEFSMKCHLCSGRIVVRTDPKTTEYIMVEGATRKNEEFTAEDLGTIELADADKRKKMDTDPMFRLEQTAEDEEKAKRAAPILDELQDLQKRSEKDFSMLRLLRKNLRDRTKKLRSEEQAMNRPGMDLKVLPATSHETRVASVMQYGDRSGATSSRVERFRMATRSILGHSRTPSSAPLQKRQQALKAAEKALARHMDLNGVLKSAQPVVETEKKAPIVVASSSKPDLGLANQYDSGSEAE